MSVTGVQCEKWLHLMIWAMAAPAVNIVLLHLLRWIWWCVQVCKINNEYELQRQSSPHLISWDTRPAPSQQQQPAPDTGHLVAQVCPNISPAQITSTVTQTLHCLITNITTLSAQYYLARRVTVSWAVPNICIFSMDRMFYIRDETKTVNLLNRLHAPFMIIFITYYLKVVWYVAASREQCGK